MPSNTQKVATQLLFLKIHNTNLSILIDKVDSSYYLFYFGRQEKFRITVE